MYLMVFLKWKHCITLLMNYELVPSFPSDLEINQSFIHFLHQGLLGWFFYFDWTLRNIWYCISDNFTKVTLAYINYILTTFLFENLNSELTFLLSLKTLRKSFFFSENFKFWCQNLVVWASIWFCHQISNNPYRKN